MLDGRHSGGTAFSGGHLYRILSNPIYIGHIPHKGRSYEGEHDPIIDAETWDKVQARLAMNAGRSGAEPALSTRACSLGFCSQQRVFRSRLRTPLTTAGAILSIRKSHPAQKHALRRSRGSAAIALISSSDAKGGDRGRHCVRVLQGRPWASRWFQTVLASQIA